MSRRVIIYILAVAFVFSRISSRDYRDSREDKNTNFREGFLSFIGP